MGGYVTVPVVDASLLIDGQSIKAYGVRTLIGTNSGKPMANYEASTGSNEYYYCTITPNIVLRASHVNYFKGKYCYAYDSGSFEAGSYGPQTGTLDSSTGLYYFYGRTDTTVFGSEQPVYNSLREALDDIAGHYKSTQTIPVVFTTRGGGTAYVRIQHCGAPKLRMNHLLTREEVA